jgi:hypothetical protein
MPIAVETVTEQYDGAAYGHGSSSGPAPAAPSSSSWEGTGIDARSGPDPSEAAQRRAVEAPGAPGSARNRASLLRQALSCRLCEFLVADVLENPSLLKDVKDPSAATAHAVDLLQLLLRDPGYGPKFALILGHYPAWKKYKSQDHSLYIPDPRPDANLVSDALLTYESSDAAASRQQQNQEEQPMLTNDSDE